MDNKELGKEDHSQAVGGLRREVDSLDDFEHLGHDSSPLKDAGTGDLLSGFKTDARDELGVINKGDDKAATAANPLELSSFDPLQPSTFGRKMDSNLLEMGDNFPDRKEADAKLDKFLQEVSSFAPPKHEEPPEIKDKDKSATQLFMEAEREPMPKKPDAHNDLLEKFSDSEPDDDDFKPSKSDKKVSEEAFKSDTYKDVDDEEPLLPQRDYPVAPEPEKVVPPEPVKQKTPEPVKQKTPEPVKEETPEPVKPQPQPFCKLPTCDPKKKPAVIDAEAIFCKMGLDTWFNPDRLNPRGK